MEHHLQTGVGDKTAARCIWAMAFPLLDAFWGGLDGNLIIGTEDQGWKQSMTLHWSLQGSNQTL